MSGRGGATVSASSLNAGELNLEPSLHDTSTLSRAAVAAAQRQRVLGLYRWLLRASRNWPRGEKERKYIREEARDALERNRSVRSPEQIEALLADAKDRIDIALHYGIAYARAVHIPPGMSPASFAASSASSVSSSSTSASSSSSSTSSSPTAVHSKRRASSAKPSDDISPSRRTTTTKDHSGRKQLIEPPAPP
eukprot:CAMPEP_0174238706 /NCGR_PEP_ID=MMETSP0417-20130205/12156_1 /TAXON_ID=242541 /ORGANISM="Mayorella sp, Strain BSH-02190019" /LENGTH=193 /DNA_ID=CAMNT_0015317575 /DNA_START=240 /DNA_END=818 /DNA_ORIENTATION=-